MPSYELIWSPEGRIIAHVDAPNERGALRQTPLPYRKFLGEVAVIEVHTTGPRRQTPEGA